METIITEPADLVRCCEHLASQKRFGFDTEFVGEESYHPTLCLIQVATTERLFLIDPLTVGPLDAFWRVLTDPAHQVVVHAGREEVRLCRFWTGQAPSNLFDLQIAAGLVGLQFPISHGNLVHELLGTRLAKAETLTEWRTRPLTREQIKYAFDDVRHLLPAHDALVQRLRQLDRLAWAEEEFARLAAGASEASVQERWRRLPGLGRLERRKLAAVRALHAWRDELAAKLNRPPRTVVRDDLLVEIAKRNPQKESDLHVVRGLAHRHARDIMEVIRQVRALPAADLPEPVEREIDPPQVSLLMQLLSAVQSDLAIRRQIAPNLIAGSNDLKQLIRGKLQGEGLPEHVLLGQGWRRRHILPELEAILSGEKRVRVADVKAEGPLDYD